MVNLVGGETGEQEEITGEDSANTCVACARCNIAEGEDGYDAAYDLKLLFEDIDENGDGYIYKEELRSYLEKLGKTGPIMCARDGPGDADTDIYYEDKEDCYIDRLWNNT